MSQHSSETICTLWQREISLQTYLKQVKQSLYKPGQALKFPGGWGSQNWQTIGTWRWWGFQPYASAVFIPKEILLVLISDRGWVDPRAIMRTEGFCQWKIPMTPSGIETTTFRFVDQPLKQMLRRMPNRHTYTVIFLVGLKENWKSLTVYSLSVTRFFSQRSFIQLSSFKAPLCKGRY
jgi:hypothetical protein